MTKNGKLAFPIKWFAVDKQSFQTPKEHLKKEDYITVEVILECTLDDQPWDVMNLIN